MKSILNATLVVFARAACHVAMILDGAAHMFGGPVKQSSRVYAAARVLLVESEILAGVR